MATIKLVVEAILALKDRTGSSVIAINKWIESEKDVSDTVGIFECSQRRTSELFYARSPAVLDCR